MLETLTLDLDWAQPLVEHLGRHVQPTACVEHLLARSVYQVLDSAMVIEDPQTPFAAMQPPVTQVPLPASGLLVDIEQVLSDVASDGLSPHFLRLVSSFGQLMLALSANEAQLNQVARWMRDGEGLGCFMMTDRGGPSLSDWRSSCIRDSDGAHCFELDKIWGIEAHQARFLIAVYRQPGVMSPVAALVPPQALAGLARVPTGEAFLDGAFRLGACKGAFQTQDDLVLRKGGIIAVKTFLSMVRPRFVRALMSHVRWLSRAGRCKLDTASWELLDYVEAAAASMSAITALTRYSEDEVLSLKFLSNAVLLALVQDGAVSGGGDRRDLLAFTKMEGSSYRTWLEVYSRAKGRRR